MNAQTRVKVFRLWRELVALKPEQFRMVKLANHAGTFQLEERKEGGWVPVSFLPPWGQDNQTTYLF